MDQASHDCSLLTVSGDLAASPLAAFAASIAVTVPTPQASRSQSSIQAIMSCMVSTAHRSCRSSPAAKVMVSASMLEGKALPPAKGLMLPACASSLTVLLRDLGCPCGDCTAARHTDGQCRAKSSDCLQDIHHTVQVQL